MLQVSKYIFASQQHVIEACYEVNRQGSAQKKSPTKSESLPRKIELSFQDSVVINPPRQSVSVGRSILMSCVFASLLCS